MNPDILTNPAAPLSDEAMASALAPMFERLWETFIDGAMGLDGLEVQEMLEATGLITTRPATAEEAQEQDFDEGDEIVVLTAEGRAVLARAKGAA